MSAKKYQNLLKRGIIHNQLTVVYLIFVLHFTTNSERSKARCFTGVWRWLDSIKKFADNKNDVIELRRLCCVDETPRNTESYFIGKSLRMLRKLWAGKFVVSYADLEYGHGGIIYQASNFQKGDFIKGSDVIISSNGKRYHDKAIRTKYKGVLKPFAVKLLYELENGMAYRKKTKGKQTYIYKLK